jgi:hypothetical protein
MMPHHTAVGMRKAGSPDGFQFFCWERIGTDALKLTGCVVTRSYAKGPRKGRPCYNGKRVSVVVTDAEAEAERTRYELETGQCGECMGSGQVFRSWSVDEGTKTRPCDVCGASGRVKP